MEMKMEHSLLGDTAIGRNQIHSVRLQPRIDSPSNQH